MSWSMPIIWHVCKKGNFSDFLNETHFQRRTRSIGISKSYTFDFCGRLFQRNFRPRHQPRHLKMLGFKTFFSSSSHFVKIYNWIANFHRFRFGPRQQVYVELHRKTNILMICMENINSVIIILKNNAVLLLLQYHTVPTCKCNCLSSFAFCVNTFSLLSHVKKLDTLGRRPARSDVPRVLTQHQYFRQL